MSANFSEFFLSRVCEEEVFVSVPQHCFYDGEIPQLYSSMNLFFQEVFLLLVEDRQEFELPGGQCSGEQDEAHNFLMPELQRRRT